MKILIIDDDPLLLRLLTIQLTSKEFEVVTAVDGKDGLKQAYNHQPDLVILDVMMPDINGYEICKRLRDFTDVPILILSARNTDTSVLRGFGVGADDYLRKPFNIEELVARVRAILSRATLKQTADITVYNDGHLDVDLKRKLVYLDSKQVHLSHTEFKLLSCLIRRRGEVVPHEVLLNEVWGHAYSDSVSLLSLYIRYLRTKLEDNSSKPRYIRTEWGIGYWFAPEPD
jgi:DNA-binding response OmpR family regulator